MNEGRATNATQNKCGDTQLKINGLSPKLPWVKAEYLGEFVAKISVGKCRFSFESEAAVSARLRSSSSLRRFLC